MSRSDEHADRDATTVPVPGNCRGRAGHGRRKRPGRRIAAARAPHFPGKAKHVIYLHMVGGPPQMDLYDYKPKMDEWYDNDLPDSVRQGQRLTTMTSGQSRFPIAPSKYKFARHGQSGMWVTELLPYTASMVDDMCFIRTHAHRGDQSRTGHHLHADRQPDHRPALPGRLGVLRPRLAQRESADLRRARRPAHQHRADAGHFRPALVGRLSAGRTCGRVLPHQRRSDPVHQQSARRVDRSPPPHAGRPAAPQRNELPGRSAIRKRTRASSNTNWPSACRPAFRS